MNSKTRSVNASVGSVLVLGDIHFPFHSRKALKKVIELVRDMQPSVIVQVGDLYDFYAFSKYPRSLNVMTPVEELTRGRELAVKFWKALKEQAPLAVCYQLKGNHDDRPLKRIAEQAPEFSSIVNATIETFFEFEGVRTINTSQEELFLNGVCYQHGHRKFGDHAPYNQMSTVTGHTHIGGVLYFQNRKGIFWELNVGWLGDKDAPVFSYRSQKTLHKTTVGVGTIDALGPRFVPL